MLQTHTSPITTSLLFLSLTTKTIVLFYTLLFFLLTHQSVQICLPVRQTSVKIQSAVYWSPLTTGSKSMIFFPRRLCNVSWVTSDTLRAAVWKYVHLWWIASSHCCANECTGLTGYLQVRVLACLYTRVNIKHSSLGLKYLFDSFPMTYFHVEIPFHGLPGSP